MSSKSSNTCCTASNELAADEALEADAVAELEELVADVAAAVAELLALVADVAAAVALLAALVA
jgi:hypothetical protein